MTETTEPSRATTMKAVEQFEFGSADDLQFKDIARPAPANDELLVHVRAASVGAWDWHDMPGDPLVMRLTGRCRSLVRRRSRSSETRGRCGTQLAVIGHRINGMTISLGVTNIQ